jgi:hypothetical protein
VGPADADVVEPAVHAQGELAVGVDSVGEGRYPVQGTVRTESAALRLGFGSDDFGYAIDLGLPPPGQGFRARPGNQAGMHLDPRRVQTWLIRVVPRRSIVAAMGCLAYNGRRHQPMDRRTGLVAIVGWRRGAEDLETIRN